MVSYFLFYFFCLNQKIEKLMKQSLIFNLVTHIMFIFTSEFYFNILLNNIFIFVFTCSIEWNMFVSLKDTGRASKLNIKFQIYPLPKNQTFLENIAKEKQDTWVVLSDTT